MIARRFARLKAGTVLMILSAEKGTVTLKVKGYQQKKMKIKNQKGEGGRSTSA